MIELKDVNHIAIICSDYERSKDFYANTLGLSIIAETFREERQSYKLDLALNGKYLIELFSFPGPPQRASYPEARGLRHLAFDVADLDEVIAELRKDGVVMEEIRHDTRTGNRAIFIKDPDDLPIELCEVT